MVLCAIGMHSFAQNVINQTVIVSGDSNNASSSNDDIGGVEFRRIPSDRKKWYYFDSKGRLLANRWIDGYYITCYRELAGKHIER